jgi:hypothetical protein
MLNYSGNETKRRTLSDYKYKYKYSTCSSNYVLVFGANAHIVDLGNAPLWSVQMMARFP